MSNFFRLLSVLPAVLILGVSASPAAEGGRPNFVVILADDMGFSDAGCYGGEIETPNLDSLAANGLRFTQFYNTARCWPSRAALLTGYYAQQVRRDAQYGDARGGGQGTRPEWAPLLPELLAPAGYRSYHSGKWHVDGKPLEGGFDRSYSFDDHDRYFTPKRHTLDDELLPPVGLDEGYFATTHIAGRAVEFLKGHAREHGTQPFFLYLAFTSPHFPLHAMREDIDRYRERYLAGWDELRRERGRKLKELGVVSHDPAPAEREVGPPYDFPKGRDSLGPGEVLKPLPWEELTSEQRAFQATKMAIHAAMVDRMDREIGRVLDQLRAMGAFDDTLILFASDNGASAEVMVRGDGHGPSAEAGSAGTFLCLGPGFATAANTPFRRHKTWVHEGGISTPLIAHWPRGIDARGELRHAPSHLIDVAPTLLELAGVGRPSMEAAPSPGRSLVPVFEKDQEHLHDDLWWCHDDHRAIRVGDWKLVALKGGPWELYDLSRDRGETDDLAARMPEKVRELEALWTRQADEFRRQAGPIPERPARRRAG